MTPTVVLRREEDTSTALDGVLVDLDDAGAADLVAVFATPHHLDGLVRIGAALAERFPAAAMFGGISTGVVAGDVEVEDGPGLVVLAARTATQPHAFHARVARDPEGRLGIVGWPRAGVDDLVVVTADARRFPAAGVLQHLANNAAGPLAGGLLDAGADVDGPTLLTQDGLAVLGGATGVVLPGAGTRSRTSQGCLPIGAPLTVTAAQGNRVMTLAGRRATDVLAEVFATAGDADRARLRNGIQLGIALPSSRDEFGVGDFLVRGIVDTEPGTGAVTVGAMVEVGQVVQLHVRDAATATTDLARKVGTLAEGAGGLLFTCNGRGEGLFGVSGHDARMVSGRLGPAVAGAFCAGEIGTLAGTPYLHGFTATVVGPLAAID